MKLVISLLALLLIGFFSTAFADSEQHINQWLNDITADNIPTRLEGDGYVIVINQVLDKSEYKVGDTISVRPERVNIGNKTVTIRHLAPLFQTLVKNQNGSIAWPSIGTAYALRSDKIALEPHKPISDESNGALQQSIYKASDAVKMTVGGESTHPSNVLNNGKDNNLAITQSRMLYELLIVFLVIL